MKRLDPRLCAHRGWTASHAENTLEALAEAQDRGCAAVEFDVHCLADDHWVVYHDQDLKRLHGNPQHLRDLTLAELRSLAPLPSLGEALEVFNERCLPMVEIKPTRAHGVESLASVVAPIAACIPVVLVARGREMPAAVHSLLPDIPLLIYARNWRQAHLRLREPWAGFDLNYRTLPHEEALSQLSALRSGAKKVAIHTVNEPEECAFWLRAGADWVITDRPADQVPASHPRTDPKGP